MSLSTLEGSSGVASSVWRWDLKPWISAPTSSLASWFPVRLPRGSTTDPAWDLSTVPRHPHSKDGAPQALDRQAPPTGPASPRHQERLSLPTTALCPQLSSWLCWSKPLRTSATSTAPTLSLALCLWHPPLPPGLGAELVLISPCHLAPSLSAHQWPPSPSHTLPVPPHHLLASPRPPWKPLPPGPGRPPPPPPHPWPGPPP